MPELLQDASHDGLVGYRKGEALSVCFGEGHRAPCQWQRWSVVGAQVCGEYGDGGQSVPGHRGCQHHRALPCEVQGSGQRQVGGGRVSAASTGPDGSFAFPAITAADAVSSGQAHGPGGDVALRLGVGRPPGVVVVGAVAAADGIRVHGAVA
ncbi:hypothetical protein CVV72_10975 [Amycolatopsis sp. TNS106]|nr:hypothetical protein CVV72_10975 [Amycolatopsis sp. TNS106]